jgi:hypothetical protein
MESQYIQFEFFMAMIMKNAILWNAAQCHVQEDGMSLGEAEHTCCPGAIGDSQ